MDTSGQPDPAPEGTGGVCATCGRPLPAPDLEAVAASIDQTLSMESGKIVPRTAWAGPVPDGALDALFSWLPAMRARRQLWERGQQLWTEQMTLALSGPCEECRAAGASLPPTSAMPAAQAGGPGQPSAAPSPYEVAESSTVMMQTPAPPLPEEGMTSAMPAFEEPPDHAELPTSAVEAPSFGGSFGHPAPASEPAPSAAGSAPSGDEHESHTVILTSMPSLRTTTRLVVLEGPVHGRQFSLARQLTTIGRSIGCHVTVESDAVSYDHARIARTPDGWQIEPMAGAGDLLVNDEVVRAPHMLRHGDVIRVGPARLRFESTSQAA